MNLKYLSYFEVVYGDYYLLSYFLSLLNKKGKKLLIEKNVYKSLSLLGIKLRENPYLIFFESIEKIKPILSIKFKKKTTRKNFFFVIIPKYLKLIEQYKTAIRWLNLALIMHTSRNDYFLKLFYELFTFNLYNESFMLQKNNENYTLILKNKFNKHYR
jgi:ribosomal protein S7